ncbi:hypothetical protein NMY22_g285 [Coprinellus aureogranulatus]|nr:hypothetical protein NMY22_g285 [Coprinellus aureogranulatus]
MKHTKDAHPIWPSSPFSDATPSPSTPGSTDSDPGYQTVSVSTAFHPGVQPDSDLVLSSSEGVLFWVHSNIISNVSDAALAAFLAHPTSVWGSDGSMIVVSLSLSAKILNIIIHIIYGKCCAVNSPSLEDLAEAVDRLPQYHLSPRVLIHPGAPIFTLLTSYVALYPLEVYSLAAHHDVHCLAEKASSHLLCFTLAKIDDSTATRIGPIYLKRLFLLQSDRVEALKHILSQPPTFHVATDECTLRDQKLKLTRAWTMGATHIALELRPGKPSRLVFVCIPSLYGA